MRLVERVERLALELHARNGRILARNLAAHQLLEIVERLRAQRLGELVVHLGPHRLGHLLHVDGEFGVLAGNFLARIVVRELDLDEALLAGLGPFEAFDEARNELALADHELDVLALAAFELHAIDTADKIDRQPITLAGRSLGLRLVLDGALHQIGDRLVHGLVGNVGDFPLELQGGEIGHRDAGKNLELHGEGEIALPREHLLDLFLVLGEIDVGLVRRPLVAILHGLAARLLHRLLHDLGHHRTAIQLLDVRNRHLALAEALELDLVLDLVDDAR